MIDDDYTISVLIAKYQLPSGNISIEYEMQRGCNQNIASNWNKILCLQITWSLGSKLDHFLDRTIIFIVSLSCFINNQKYTLLT